MPNRRNPKISKPEHLRRLPLRMPRTKQEAYYLFVKPHLESIKVIANSYKLKGVEASDVIQLTTIKVFEKLHLFKPVAPIGSWVNTIAKNTCIDLARKAARRPESSILDFLLDKGIDSDKRSGRRVKTPDEVLIEHEEDAANRKLHQRFLKSLEFLKPKDAELVCRVFGLAGFNKQSYTEVSTALRIPVGTVNSRLHAAKIAITRMLILH